MPAYTIDDLEKRISGLANLPTLPGVLKRAEAMAGDDEACVNEVADVIAADQVLSAKILRFINSPVYGFPGRISSVRHAIVLLGFNVVKGLVLGAAIFDALGPPGRGLWGHSLGCALLSRSLSEQLGLDDPSEVMMAGLLHDIGKVGFIYLAPDQWNEAAALAEHEHMHIGAAEKQVFGADHARAGGWIAAAWRFPVRLWEPIACHHRPSSAKEHRPVTSVVHVADILARSMGYGSPGDMTLPAFDEKAYHQLGVKLVHIDAALREAEREYPAAASLFSTDGGEA